MDFLKLLKPDAHVARNGFDLSRKHVFSSKVGELKPCLCVETLPNDYFEIDLASLTRTETMNSAAFLRGKMRYDFFFVPYSQLWHPFNQFISQRKDVHSANQKGILYCPTIDLKEIVLFAYDSVQGASEVYHFDVHGREIGFGLINLLNMLGYGDFSWIWNTNVTSADIANYFADNFPNGCYVNVWRLAAYQHIWYDFYRNKFYDLDDTRDTGGIEGYDGGFARVNVDMFNFDDIDCSSVANSRIGTSSSAEIRRMARLCQPRYVQWKRDLFTSLLPGQQFGAVSSVSIFGNATIQGTAVLNGNTGSDVGKWKPAVSGNQIYNDNALHMYTQDNQNGTVTQVDNNGSPRTIYHTHPVSGTAQLNSQAGINMYNAFDVLALRKAEMLQAWKQATLRAGNQVDDNFKAHFGVEPYYEGDNVVDFLGSFSSSLQVNSIESTATTGQSINGKVGDLAATGTCVVNGNKLKFHCRDFGVIMCLSSFLPESEYRSTGIDKANVLFEQFDYPTPEFQNIGLEAVPKSQFDINQNLRLIPTDVLGFAPRYWDYKTSYDKVYDEFQNLNATWNHNNNVETFQKFGSLTPWVAPRSMIYYKSGGAVFNDISNLYVNPSVMNSIFGITATALMNTNQLLNNVYFDIKAVRPLSELGLPQF